MRKWSYYLLIEKVCKFTNIYGLIIEWLVRFLALCQVVLLAIKPIGEKVIL